MPKQPHIVKIFVSMGEDAKWNFIQKCSDKEIKTIKNWAESLTSNNCSFIHYYAKDFYLKLVSLLQPY
jgi:hypothetical protein